jgi:beta-glucosidase
MKKQSPSRAKMVAILLWMLATSTTAQKAAMQSAHVSPSNPQLATRAIEQRVNALLAKMTLKEKLGQLVQYNADGAAAATVTDGRQNNLAANPQVGYHLDATALAENGGMGSMLNVPSASIRAYQQGAVEKSRLHIPLLFGADVIHGYRTVYPVPLGLAASFDPAMVTSVARMAAQEASTYGIRWFYSPMVDISRDARWGRTMEGAGEDAYLGAAMARAYVRGYQGDALSNPDSVAATIKHFAAYGAAEAGREYNTTDMSQSRLFQDYLPPYKSGVEAGAVSVMSAFNSLNGVPSTANPYLLNTILRKQWGFDGVVVSDYTAILELMHHGVALDAATATEKAFNAGVDIDMMSHFYDMQLPELIRSGRVSMADVDEAVRRVLRLKFALGLLEHPYPAEPLVDSLTPEHKALALKAAEESIVLLQNKQVSDAPLLPLKRGTKIALIGPLADNALEMVGSSSGEFRESEVVTVRAALQARAAAANGSVLYAQGTQIESDSDAGFAEAETAARQSDVVVLALGESGAMSGEAASRAHLDLPGNQQQLLKKVVALGKPVVVLVFSGRPLVLASAAGQAQALVEVWFPGIEAGEAIANVLYGDVAPSGKLPMSFPAAVGQEPLYYNQFPTGRPANDADLNKPPGADTKFISRYIDAPNAALFPFGFGLSYSTFQYSAVAVSQPSVPLRAAHPGVASLVTATATVTNAGTRAATEVVQCYVGNRGASLEQPVRSLQGFERVALEPGESKQVSFPLGFNELEFFDNTGKQVIEPTQYTVWIGGDSTAANAAQFRITR